MIDEVESSGSNSDSMLTSQQLRTNMGQAFIILGKLSPSNEEVTHCHQLISSMMKMEVFFDTLTSLMVEHQSGKHPHLVKLMLTTLGTFVKHQTTQSRLVKKMDRTLLNHKFLEVLTKSTLNQDYKHMMMRPYSQFIYAPGMETIRGQTIDHLCNSFSLAMLTLPQNVPHDVFFGSEKWVGMSGFIPVAQGLAKGPIEHHHLKTIVNTFFQPVEGFILRGLEGLRTAICKQDQTDFTQTSQLLVPLIEFFREMVLNTSKDHLYVLKTQLMKDQKIKQIVMETLALAFHKHSPYKGPTEVVEVVINSNGDPLVDRLNLIKRCCFDVVNHFTKLVVAAQNKPNQKDKEEYCMPKEMSEFVLVKVPEVLVGEFVMLQYPQQSLPHPSLYKGIIQTLANIIRIGALYKTSEKLRSLLLYQLCLPLLQPPLQIKSPADYKAIREDILNMHCMDIPQNAVCKLIESFVDKIDGSVMLLATHMRHLVEFHLSANPHHYQQLPSPLTEGHFFAKVSYHIQIDCALSVLALLSYLAPTRMDLVLLVEELLCGRADFMLAADLPPHLKCAVFLCYSYYVDNFYALLSEVVSTQREFHMRVLEHCCNNIGNFSSREGLQGEEAQWAEVVALQSMDCISNCINQKLWIGLLWGEGGWRDESSRTHFQAIFAFLLQQLTTRINITTIDAIISFYVETIKNHTTHGFKVRRTHYETHTPPPISTELTTLIAQKLPTIYSTPSLPQASLLRNRLLQLLELMVTCAQRPDHCVGQELLKLQVERGCVWEVVGVVDVLVRRQVQMHLQGQPHNETSLGQALRYCLGLLWLCREERQLRELFGIMVSCVTVQPQLVGTMATPVASLLVELLRQEEQLINYEESLEKLITDVAYIALLGVHLLFSPATAATWVELTRHLQTYLESRQKQGLVGLKISPYLGKILAICLVVMYHMREKMTASDTTRSQTLLNAILHRSEVYQTPTEKHIVAHTLTKMLLHKDTLQAQQPEYVQSFTLICWLLHSAGNYPSVLDEEQVGESSSSESSDDEADENTLNYREYTISYNQYTRSENRESYLLNLKTLCHKLNEKSHDFMKGALQQMSVVLQKFVKEQVYYFEGDMPTQGMRNIRMVKKQ